MATILDGKGTATKIQESIKTQSDRFEQAGIQRPHLAAILVGEHAPSVVYVNNKMKACERAGFISSLIRLPADITQDKLIRNIRQLNADPGIDGYIVQLPLPRHISEEAVNQAIDPLKDVDGFHPANLGKMVLGMETYLPATPLGILELLKAYNIDTDGKHCVVIGRSHIVGTPVSILLSRKGVPGNATVTLTHSRTRNIETYTQQADIVIVAIGKAGFLTGDMIKPGAVVIDVGTNRVDDYSRKSGFRLAGDADFESIVEKAAYVSPVPGGVGPMTITGLLINTLQAAMKRLP